jgi:cation diffusion facilitator family transporter
MNGDRPVKAAAGLPTGAQPRSDDPRLALATRRRRLLLPVGILFGVHLALLAAQVLTAVITGSVAIGANALHIAVDSAVHIVAIGGVWLATRPADVHHPYGYERYEALASLVIGMLLLVVVALIVSSAVPRLVQPAPNRATGLGAIVMAGSTLSTALLALYLQRRGRQLASRVLFSEATHALTDSLVTLGVLAAVALSGIGLWSVDPLVALAVAGVVAWRGWEVVRGAAEVLTDTAVIDIATIRAAAEAVPGVLDCHAIRSRGEAGHVRVDLHVHVAPDLSIVEAHRIARDVEQRIREVDAGIAEVLVHLGAGPSVP